MRQRWKYIGRQINTIGIQYHVWSLEDSRVTWAYQVDRYYLDTVGPA
jgi:hypothetical protein